MSWYENYSFRNGKTPRKVLLVKHIPLDYIYLKIYVNDKLVYYNPFSTIVSVRYYVSFNKIMKRQMYRLKKIA